MNDIEITTDLTKKILKRKAEPNNRIITYYCWKSESQISRNLEMINLNLQEKQN
jgi:hypothetical protein